MISLRQQMLDELKLRNLSAGTQKHCIRQIAQFAKHYNISPDRLGLDEVRNYRLYLLDQKQLSPQSVNGFVSAAKFLYTQVLDMPWSKRAHSLCPGPHHPLTSEEIDKFFKAIGLVMHRVVLMLCYGSGLRIAEAVSLQVSDIDSKRMLAHETTAPSVMAVSLFPARGTHSSRHHPSHLPRCLPDDRHHQTKSPLTSSATASPRIFWRAVPTRA